MCRFLSNFAATTGVLADGISIVFFFLLFFFFAFTYRGYNIPNSCLIHAATRSADQLCKMFHPDVSEIVLHSVAREIEEIQRNSDSQFRGVCRLAFSLLYFPIEVDEGRIRPVI